MQNFTNSAFDSQPEIEPKPFEDSFDKRGKALKVRVAAALLFDGHMYPSKRVWYNVEDTKGKQSHIPYHAPGGLKRGGSGDTTRSDNSILNTPSTTDDPKKAIALMLEQTHGNAKLKENESQHGFDMKTVADIDELSGEAGVDGSTSGKGRQSFPEQLLHLLEDGSAAEAAWWLPGDTAFAVEPFLFQEKVLDIYFQRSKFESFIRKLNRWGFKRMSGKHIRKDSVAFHHKLFRKGQPEQVKKMRNSQRRDVPPIPREELNPLFGAPKTLKHDTRPQSTASGGTADFLRFLANSQEVGVRISEIEQICRMLGRPTLPVETRIQHPLLSLHASSSFSSHVQELGLQLSILQQMDLHRQLLVADSNLMHWQSEQAHSNENQALQIQNQPSLSELQERLARGEGFGILDAAGRSTPQVGPSQLAQSQRAEVFGNTPLFVTQAGASEFRFPMYSSPQSHGAPTSSTVLGMPIRSSSGIAASSFPSREHMIYQMLFLLQQQPELRLDDN